MINKFIRNFLMIGFFILIQQTSVYAYDYSYFDVARLEVGSNEAMANGVTSLIDAEPYILEGRVMVPIGFMKSALGANITWDEASRTANLKLANADIKVAVGSIEAKVNGETVKMDVASEIRDNRLFVPIRFLSENMGARIQYFPESKGIQICNLKNLENWVEYQDEQTGFTFNYPKNLKKEDIANGIRFTTETGTTFELTRLTSTPIVASLNKKEELTRLGWDVYAYREIRTHDLFKGITMVADKQGLFRLNFDSYFFNAGDAAYSWIINPKGVHAIQIYEIYLAGEMFSTSYLRE